jgi:large subunit ribosomal protein L23
VDTDANKVQIKKAVETNYGVSVDKVRTMRYGAERKIRYTKTGIQRGKSARIKKAIVQLAEGDTIDFYNKL